jgi:hypothetical protein
MGVGGGLATWVTKHAMPYINWNSSFVKSTRQLLTAFIKLAVFSTLPSTKLANYCADSVEALLTPEDLPRLTKSIGEDLGVLSMLLLSPMGFLIMFTLPIATRQAHQLLKCETIYLKTACIHSYEKQLPSVSTLLRINHLLLALSITGYTQEYRVMIQALMGIAASLGMMRLGDAIFNEFQVEILLTPEDRSYLQFILSTGGLEIGNFIAEMYYLINHKLIAREALEQQLELISSKKTTYHAKFPDLRLSPALWFTSQNPFTLFSITANNTQESACQLRSEVFSDAGMVKCEAPHRITSLISAS